MLLSLVIQFLLISRILSTWASLDLPLGYGPAQLEATLPPSVPDTLPRLPHARITSSPPSSPPPPSSSPQFEPCACASAGDLFPSASPCPSSLGFLVALFPRLPLPPPRQFFFMLGLLDLCHSSVQLLVSFHLQ